MERSNTSVRKAVQVESFQLCLCMAVVGTVQNTDSPAYICRFQVACVVQRQSIGAIWLPNRTTGLPKTLESVQTLRDRPLCSRVDDCSCKPESRHRGPALPCSMLLVVRSRWRSTCIQTAQTYGRCYLAEHKISCGSGWRAKVLTVFRSFSRVVVSQ